MQVVVVVVVAAAAAVVVAVAAAAAAAAIVVIVFVFIVVDVTWWRALTALLSQLLICPLAQVHDFNAINKWPEFLAKATLSSA
eukprot:804591-Pelagomonas_calceolata.AAC.11